MRNVDIDLFDLSGDMEEITKGRALEPAEIVGLARVFARAYAKQFETSWIFFDSDDISVIATDDGFGNLRIAEDIQIEVFGEIKYDIPK